MAAWLWSSVSSTSSTLAQLIFLWTSGEHHLILSAPRSLVSSDTTTAPAGWAWPCWAPSPAATATPGPASSGRSSPGSSHSSLRHSSQFPGSVTSSNCAQLSSIFHLGHEWRCDPRGAADQLLWRPGDWSGLLCRHHPVCLQGRPQPRPQPSLHHPRGRNGRTFRIHSRQHSWRKVIGNDN